MKQEKEVFQNLSNFNSFGNIFPKLRYSLKDNGNIFI